MRADLIAAGIPAARIQPDYAGLRTLDSVLRADRVFGNRDYIIVSQPFHRAAVKSRCRIRMNYFLPSMA